MDFCQHHHQLRVNNVGCLPGVGFKLTDDGNYDIDGKLLTNVGEPTGDGDATTKK